MTSRILTRARAIALMAAALLTATGCAVPDPTAGGTLADVGAPPPPARTDAGIPYGARPDQLLDIHRPVVQTGGVIVFLHGGGWVEGGRADVSPLALRQVARGWVLVSVDYALSRFEGEGAGAVALNPFPAAIADVKLALRFVRGRGALLGIDASTVVVWGESAGGQLAALGATSAGQLEPPDLPAELADVSSRPDGAVVLAAPVDMSDWVAHVDQYTGATRAERLAAGSTVRTIFPLYFDCVPFRPETCDPGRVVAASAHTYFDVGDPPLYLAYGGRDPLAPPSQTFRLIDAYNRADIEELLWVDAVEAAGHTTVADGVNLAWLDAFLDLVLLFGS